MDNRDAWFLAADQCRARAELIRRTAESMNSETVRLNLCRLAERYEEMAARIERSAGTVAEPEPLTAPLVFGDLDEDV